MLYLILVLLTYLTSICLLLTSVTYLSYLALTYHTYTHTLLTWHSSNCTHLALTYLTSFSYSSLIRRSLLLGTYLLAANINFFTYGSSFTYLVLSILV